MPSEPGGATGDKLKPIGFQVTGSWPGGVAGDLAGLTAGLLSAVPGESMLGGLLSGAMGKREVAHLDIFEPPANDKGVPSDKAEKSVTFMYNPKDLSITKAAQWARPPVPAAPSSAAPTFTGSSATTLSVEMFFDSSGDMGLTTVYATESLLGCCVPTAKSLEGANPNPSPPWVMFRWGKITGFFGIVKSVNVKYTLFTPEGVPIRAVCAVSVEEIGGNLPRQNPTSGSLTAMNMHLLVAGDTLASVSQRHYGTPNAWRAIAEANVIDDPTRLRVGSTLLIPALAELDEKVAEQRRGARSGRVAHA